MKLRNYIHNLPSLKGNLIYVDGINLDVKLENADSFNISSSGGSSYQLSLSLSHRLLLLGTCRYFLTFN